MAVKLDISKYVDLDRVACSGDTEDLFYAEGKDAYQKTQEAKKICASCDMLEQCFKYAMEAKEEWGVWGGATADERKYLARSPRERSRFLGNLRRGVFIRLVKPRDENAIFDS